MLQLGTNHIYLCIINLKTEVIMWLAVIISVCLAVEVLSYLSGGNISIEKDNHESVGADA